MTTPKRAAAVGAEADGERNTSTRIESSNPSVTDTVKVGDRDYASALECVMACGCRWCPYECPRIGGAA